MPKRCTCENKSHNEKSSASKEDQKHAYMAEVETFKTVKTIFGTFDICPICMEEHPIPDEYLK